MALSTEEAHAAGSCAEVSVQPRQDWRSPVSGLDLGRLGWTLSRSGRKRWTHFAFSCQSKAEWSLFFLWLTSLCYRRALLRFRPRLLLLLLRSGSRSSIVIDGSYFADRRAPDDALKSSMSTLLSNADVGRSFDPVARGG